MDHFIRSMGPYNIIMGDFNNDIWAAAPVRPRQEGLDDASLFDPLLATPHHPDKGQYYTGRESTAGAMSSRLWPNYC